jgi:hypothetical protein
MQRTEELNDDVAAAIEELSEVAPAHHILSRDCDPRFAT